MRKKGTTLLVAAVLLIAEAVLGARPAGPEEPLHLRVSSTYTNVQFTVFKWTVLKQEGFFRKSSGTILYDPADPARSSVRFTVDVTSIDTRNSSRDNVLRSDDFFDARQYPTMTFVSSTVRPSSSKDELSVTGELTIRGITKRIMVPVKVYGVGAQAHAGRFAGFETNFALDRTDFGVNGTRWSGGNAVISKQVLVHLTVGALTDSCQDAPVQPCD